MRRRIIVFIAIIIIPILILLADHFLLHEEIHVNASYDDSIAWKYISQHQDQYPHSLLKLAMRNKETIPFVYQYPQKYQQDVNMNITDELKDDQIPMLLQWDERWGYKVYGDDMMAINGCGPTCLSMVISYLKGSGQYHPYYIAQYAYRHGYYRTQGTSWSLMSDGAKSFGVKVKELPLDEQTIIYHLKNHHPVICSVSNGIFTSTGHFIVLREYKDGYIYVNDPNSIEKSQKGYTFDEIKNQIKNLWTYYL